MISHSRHFASLPLAVGTMLLVGSMAIRKRTEVDLDTHFNSTGQHPKCEELVKVSAAAAKASNTPSWLPDVFQAKDTICSTNEPSYCVIAPLSTLSQPLKSRCSGRKVGGWTCDFVIDAASCEAADMDKTYPDIWMHENVCVCKKDSDMEKYKNYLIQIRKEKAFKETIGHSSLNHQPGIKMLIFDFDKTLAVTHMFNLLRNSPPNEFGLCPGGPCPAETLQQLASKGLWTKVFGGREAMLRGYFEKMSKRKVSIYVASFGFHAELMAGLEHLGVTQYVPSNHVVGIDTCDGCPKFPEHGSKTKFQPVTAPPESAKAQYKRKKRNPNGYHKAVQIKNWAHGKFKPEEILLVDDDFGNTADITEGFGHAVYVNDRQGVTENQLKVVENFGTVPCCVEVTRAPEKKVGDYQVEIGWWTVKSENKEGEWWEDMENSARAMFQRLEKCPSGVQGYTTFDSDHHERWTECSWPEHGR